MDLGCGFLYFDWWVITLDHIPENILILIIRVQFLNGDDALLDQIDHGPSLDVPTLRKPSTGPLTGPPGQYRRSRYLDISCLADNLRTTKRMLEDEAQNWKINGIPMRWKVSVSFCF